jgi:N-acetylglutamate synthase-like GNAT family acetyltransferase
MTITVTAEGNPSNHQLRRAQLEDANALDELVREAYSKYIPLIGREPMPMKTDHARAIAEQDVWVLEQESEIIAVLDMVPKEDNLYIDNVTVKNTHQSRGIGKRLLAFAETRAQELGLNAMTLCTNERFKTNLEMYARLGYVETHRVHVQGTDAVHMRKKLNTKEN